MTLSFFPHQLLKKKNNSSGSEQPRSSPVLSKFGRHSSQAKPSPASPVRTRRHQVNVSSGLHPGIAYTVKTEDCRLRPFNRVIQLQANPWKPRPALASSHLSSQVKPCPQPPLPLQVKLGTYRRGSENLQVTDPPAGASKIPNKPPS
jgi:hypothetical protein